MTSFDQNWQVWALLSALFAALTAIFAKLGVAETHPDLATFLRTLVILAMLGAMVAAGPGFGGAAAVSWKGAGFLILSGLATGASWLCYFRALRLGEASRVAPVDKLSVALVVIIAALFLGERPSPAGWAGAGLIVAGATLLALG